MAPIDPVAKWRQRGTSNEMATMIYDDNGESDVNGDNYGVIDDSGTIGDNYWHHSPHCHCRHDGKPFDCGSIGARIALLTKLYEFIHSIIFL